MFNEKINKKLKQPKQFHQALRTHSVVDTKMSCFESCKINPNLLNDAFLSNNNADVDDEKITEEITKIMDDSSDINTKFEFHEVSSQEVIKIVKSIKTNACGVDDISAFFIKISIQYTADILAEIINSSFHFKTFPKRWKQAIIKPVPKVANPTKASDFRPISLLPAFSKICEKIAAKQMSHFLKEHRLLDHLQSAYKKSHSTTTALLNVTDDIYEALDDSEITLLILLDYSKAFDTANHRLILAKLRAAGFHDDALSWINSYLSNRQQKVKTDSDSDWQSLKNGVPQGSILGPLLFTVLVSDISSTVTSGKYHTYADDQQWYLNFKPNNAITAFNTANTFLNSMDNYSDRNCLKLNTEKTKYIVIGSKCNLKKLSYNDLPLLKLKGDLIERKADVKNLGVVFDENMSWTNHINISVGKAYGRLKQAYKFRNFLSLDSRFTLCETYILSLFNYGDVLFMNMSICLKNKIQRVQNSCMRYIFGLRKYDHISQCYTIRKSLNMENRRIMHGLTLMHKIRTGESPEYLANRINIHSDIHNYNTRGRHNIAVQRVNTAARSGSFFISISKLYNETLNYFCSNILDKISVDTYKKKCKAYLTEKQFSNV